MQKASWIFLAIGVGAFLLALVLYLIIRRVRRRWKEGRQALADLRNQARSMELTMESPAGKVGGGPRTLEQNEP